MDVQKNEDDKEGKHFLCISLVQKSPPGSKGAVLGKISEGLQGKRMEAVCVVYRYNVGRKEDIGKTIVQKTKRRFH